MTINEFITQQKIDEAKRLLTFTGRSISAISESLSFSSQCYFQNVLKKLLKKHQINIGQDTIAHKVLESMN